MARPLVSAHEAVSIYSYGKVKSHAAPSTGRRSATVSAKFLRAGTIEELKSKGRLVVHSPHRPTRFLQRRPAPSGRNNAADGAVGNQCLVVVDLIDQPVEAPRHLQPHEGAGKEARARQNSFLGDQAGDLAGEILFLRRPLVEQKECPLCTLQ